MGFTGVTVGRYVTPCCLADRPTSLYRLIAELGQRWGNYGVHRGDGRSVCDTVLSGR